MNYVHHIPGRLRIRSAAIRGNEAGAQTAKAAIRRVSGIGSVEANTLTGSITVLYDPKVIDAENVLAILRQHGFTAQAGIPDRKAVRRLSQRQIGAAIAKRVANFALEAALEKSVAVLVAAIL